ncbi:hypothetical protein J5J83_03295 [Azoarcus sp. L1K30]|uniref:choice-of-anchor U domain-containing protein n=1 Tax=Azoarcus sp. L1K30 TaxID=2820277 RepID=UPI001B82D831|nr:choice-of-anchor U domain-containing protein [Azoarcus sp. L1K30]MBR0565141.1 hypothetical protein [Azoarcus sp. L1K30]
MFTAIGAIVNPLAAYAACTSTGTIIAQHCAADYIQFMTGTGTTSLTVDSETTASVELRPDPGASGPYDQTLNLTGNTVINRTDYSGVIMQTTEANRKATVTAESTVNITSNGGFGGIWVRNDTSGAISITSAATVHSTGSDGVTASTNLGPVTVSNDGHVTSVTDRGLYADGGYNDLVSSPVVVSITNTGTVNAYQAGARSINYQGLSTINNIGGTVTSTTRQGLVAWSNNGAASITNSGIVSSGDDSALQGASEYGDVTVINSGTLTAADDPAVVATRAGYSGIRAGVDMDPGTVGAYGNVTVTNTLTGNITAADDYAIAAETPSGTIDISNGGSVSGQHGVSANSAAGPLDITNSGQITATGGAGYGINVLAATSGTISNSGTITGPAASIRTDAASALTLIANQAGGTLDGQLSLQGTGPLTNAGTIVLPANTNSTLNGGYTQAISGTVGTLRVKVNASSQFGKLTVSGSASLPAGAKIEVITGNPATCGGITTGTTLPGVISATTLSSANLVVTDDCTDIDLGAVKNGNAIDLVPIVNGSCGSADGVATAFAPTSNLCVAGTASGVSSASPWAWSCNGSSSGTNASCSAPNALTGTTSGNARAEISGSTWTVDTVNSAGFIATTGHAKSPPSLPAGYTFPHGLFDLRLVTGAAGSGATVTITYPSNLPPGTVWWKYGKTIANPVAHWYQFAGATISGNTVTLTLQDGGAGDDDLLANSVIVDPGGPGAPLATPIPMLSDWGRILLSALMVLGGIFVLRRKIS